MPAIDWYALDRHWNCRLTVRGRKSGKERTVTIWYAVGDGKVFLTGGPERPQWVRNAAASPDVWYRYDATSTIGVTVSTCGAASFDTVLTAFHGEDPSRQH